MPRPACIEGQRGRGVGLTIETASGAEGPRWWAAGDHGAVLAHVIEDVQIEHRIGRLQAAHEVSEDGA